MNSVVRLVKQYNAKTGGRSSYMSIRGVSTFMGNSRYLAKLSTESIV